MSVLTQSAQLGFTHSKTIKYTDFTETGSGIEEIFDLFTVPKDSIVMKVAFYLVTAFDGASSTNLAIQVGDVSNDDRYITATEIHLDATEISSGINSGADFNDGTTDNTVNGVVHDAAADTTMTVTLNPTADSLTDFDAGEVRVMAQIIDLSVAI